VLDGYDKIVPANVAQQDNVNTDLQVKN
jgi:hypothetical protein